VRLVDSLASSATPLEDNIIAERSHVIATRLQKMRTKLNEDRVILQSLSPTSLAHQELRRRLEESTLLMLNLEEQLDGAQLAEQHQAVLNRQREMVNSTRMGGVILAGIGLIVTISTWGSWWVIAGLMVTIFGIAGISTAKDS
jgi:hypothetical protein